MSDEATTSSRITPSASAPEGPRPGADSYSAEHYSFLSRLIDSNFARDMYDQIRESGLSLQCKKGGYKVLINLFDPNSMLANHGRLTDGEMAIKFLDCEQLLNLWDFECVESDVRNPEYMNIKEGILHAYKAFISRPAERRQLFTQEQTVEYKTPPQQPMASPSIIDRLPLFSRRRPQ